jgi:hypothetical protein
MPKKNPRGTEAPHSKAEISGMERLTAPAKGSLKRLKRRAKDGEGFTREGRTKDGVAISGEIVFRDLMTENRPHSQVGGEDGIPY